MQVKNIMMIIHMTTTGDKTKIMVDTNVTTIILNRIMITEVIIIEKVKIIEKITTIIIPRTITINHKRSILIKTVEIIIKKVQMGNITIEEIKLKIYMENIMRKQIMKTPILTGI